MAVAITRRDLWAGDLRREAARTRDAKAARRMLAIALVLEGRSREDAAESCGMDRQTLRDWAHRYKRKWATIRRIVEELRRIRHDPIDEQGHHLARMLAGHYAYFSVPTNIAAVRAVHHHAKVRWYLRLRRRSQRRRLKWRRMNVIVERHLPKPGILHPWPEQRFYVKHRRQEPDA